MKLKLLAVASAVALVALALPALATPITLEFLDSGIPQGDNGGQSYMNIFSSADANANNFAVNELIVAGTPSEDGTYALTGTVNGYAGLSFNTSTDFIQIVGGVPSFIIGNGTTLLAGSGLPFTDVAIATPSCTDVPSHTCPTVSFMASDSIAANLVTDLGLSGNSWEVDTFASGNGTGNGFPQAAASAFDLKVPEPWTIAIFGAALVGIALIKRRKNKGAGTSKMLAA